MEKELTVLLGYLNGFMSNGSNFIVSNTPLYVKQYITMYSMIASGALALSVGLILIGIINHMRGCDADTPEVLLLYLIGGVGCVLSGFFLAIVTIAPSYVLVQHAIRLISLIK